MTDKYYIVENPDFIKESRFIEKARKERNQLIIDFFKEYGIDGKCYRIHGDGSCNVPFSDKEKSNIRLEIDSTEQNKNNFGNQLRKNPLRNGLFDFKKSSTVLKVFQNVCVERQIIVNLWEHFVGDYFTELQFDGYSQRHFEVNGIMYLQVNSRYDSLTPVKDGFTEIKASDFFKVLETLEEVKK